MPNSVRIPFAWLLKRLGPHDTVVVAKLIPRDKNNVIHSNRMQYFQSIWDTEDPSHLIVTLLWFCIVVLYNSMVQEHDLFLNLFGEYCHVTIVSVARSNKQEVTFPFYMTGMLSYRYRIPFSRHQGVLLPGALPGPKNPIQPHDG